MGETIVQEIDRALYLIPLTGTGQSRKIAVALPAEQNFHSEIPSKEKYDPRGFSLFPKEEDAPGKIQELFCRFLITPSFF
jgi:hypothetical protein